MEKNLKIINLLLSVVFALSLVYFTLRLVDYHYYLINFPYANTLREAAMMTSTEALLHKFNPYSMVLQPQYMNQYGIVYPLCVWPFAKIFGNTIVIHRFVTGISILGSCFLIFIALKRMAIPLLLNLWAVLMLYGSLLYPGTSTPTIDPGATAMFFLLLTVLIPLFFKFSYPSLIISILFGLLAFYTKIYGFLGVFILCSFMFLFVSKRKALFYGLLLLFFFITSIIIINNLLPSYFDNCFFAAINMGPAWSSTERLFTQIRLYTEIHFWAFLLSFICLGWYIIRYFINKNKNSPTKIITVKTLLINRDIILIVYGATASSLVLYFSLGRHSGSMLWYFFQLLSPFLLVLFVWLFSKNKYWPIICTPFLIVSLYHLTLDTSSTYFKNNLENWKEIKHAIDTYEHILNSPVIAPLLEEEHKEVTDDGQAEYFVPGGQRNYWMKGWLKEDKKVFIQQLLFFQNIHRRLQNKYYDLIILQPSLLPLGIGDDIRKYYRYEGAIDLYAPQDRRSYNVTVWRPN